MSYLGWKRIKRSRLMHLFEIGNNGYPATERSVCRRAYSYQVVGPKVHRTPGPTFRCPECNRRQIQEERRRVVQEHVDRILDRRRSEVVI